MATRMSPWSVRPRWPEPPFASTRRRGLLRTAGAAVVAAALFGTVLASAASATEGVHVTTPYPAVAVAAGTDVSFEITVDSATPSRVDLRVEQVPEGWTATLRGGGFVVDGVQAGGEEPPQVTLDVAVPAEATGTQDLLLRATSGGTTTDLPLTVRIETTAAGSVALTPEFPQLRGASDATYRFTLDLANETAEERTFAINAQGPEGWDVTARITGQEQAASAIVEAGGSVGLEVEVTPAQNAGAGAYPILVEASGGGETVAAELAVEITGNYSMQLTTPDERLNASGSAGSEIRQTLVVRNDGTAPLEGVELTSTAPTGWTVRFDPAVVPTVAPQDEGQVSAIITPTGDAIAGDYVVTLTAENENANASQQLRVTVETSLLWGAIGIGLILLVLAGLWFVFRRFGRR